MIGASSSCPLKASKTLIVRKAVFHLGNIDCSYTVSDIEVYIRSLGVTILSCFELKHADKQPLDNKAFRICIAANGKQKLCDNSNWSVGVSLREWVHKPKDTTVASSAAAGQSATSAADNSSSTIAMQVQADN